MIPTAAFLEEICREAGKILLRHYGALKAVDKKSARDLVTEADREAERLVLERIRGSFPEDPVLAEETLSDQAMAPRLWIVDPLDGTTNFVCGIPHFAVSVAFWENGSPTVGCVFNPRLDECFLATLGGGAFKNGRPIVCRAETRLADSVLATGFAYRREEKADSNLRHFADLSFRTRGLRRLGSAALDLCYVAEGVLDGFWELHLAPWDVAAGALVAREAGCKVTDFRGGEDWLFGGQIVAANPGLIGPIRDVLGEPDPGDTAGPAYRAAEDLERQ